MLFKDYLKSFKTRSARGKEINKIANYLQVNPCAIRGILCGSFKMPASWAIPLYEVTEGAVKPHLNFPEQYPVEYVGLKTLKEQSSALETNI